MWIIADDGSRYCEVLGSAMVLGNIYRGSGTGTTLTGTGKPKKKITSGLLVPVPLSPVPIPLSRKSPVA